MQRRAFDSLDRSLVPRADQRVTVMFFDLRVPGKIVFFQNGTVQLSADSTAQAKLLQTPSRLTASYTLAQGMVDIDFSLINVSGNLVNLQVIGEPTLRQRRRHPRVMVCVPGRLAWPNFLESPSQMPGHTRNLSLDGALVRFDETTVPVPVHRRTTLFELDLPTGPVSAVADFVQVWDDGARLHFVHMDARDGDRLADFIDLKLR